MATEHRCPDCGLVYECIEVAPCLTDYRMRCTPCHEAHTKHFLGLVVAARAYAEYVKEEVSSDG